MSTSFKSSRRWRDDTSTSSSSSCCTNSSNSSSSSNSSCSSYSDDDNDATASSSSLSISRSNYTYATNQRRRINRDSYYPLEQSVLRKFQKQQRHYFSHTTATHTTTTRHHLSSTDHHTQYCLAIQSHDPNVTVINVDDSDDYGITRTFDEVYQLANSILCQQHQLSNHHHRHTTKMMIRHMKLNIAKLDYFHDNYGILYNKYIRASVTDKDLYGNNCRLKKDYVSDTDKDGRNNEMLRKSNTNCYGNKDNVIVEAFYETIAKNSSIRTVIFQNYKSNGKNMNNRSRFNPNTISSTTNNNDSALARSFSFVLGRLLDATSRNKYIQTLYLHCIIVPIEKLSEILSSSSSSSSLTNLIIDDCDFVLLHQDGLYDYDEEHFEDNEDFDNEEEDNLRTIREEILLAAAFGSNKTLKHITLYRINEIYMNAILIQLRSSSTLQTLALALPGTGISLGSIEGSISYTPTHGWANAIGTVLLSSSCTVCLHVLHLYSIQFNETTFNLLSNGVQNCTTIDTICFDYCRFVCDTYHQAGYNRIQQDFQNMFVKEGTYNPFSANDGLVLSSSDICSKIVEDPVNSKMMSLCIRQTSFYTNNNPLYNCLSDILMDPTCTLQSLTTTSLSEQDFIALMHSLCTYNKKFSMLSLQRLCIEFNVVEHESATDIIRTKVLIETLPKMKHLRYLQIGLGVGIDTVLRQQLLTSFEQNSSLYHVQIAYLGARPFFNEPIDSHRLQAYQKRNKYLPKLLHQVMFSLSNETNNNLKTHQYHECIQFDNTDDTANDTDSICETKRPSSSELLIPQLLAATIGWENGATEIFHFVMKLTFL